MNTENGGHPDLHGMLAPKVVVHYLEDEPPEPDLQAIEQRLLALGQELRRKRRQAQGNALVVLVTLLIVLLTQWPWSTLAALTVAWALWVINRRLNGEPVAAPRRRHRPLD